MSYTVLARKYRPQTFSDLVGQDHVTRTLTNAITSGRVAHAFLFSGVRGVGKTTSARILAKALNCEKGSTPEPCNQCDVCREITAGVDLDVLEIDGASNNSVDDVRRLQESIPYRPSRDRFKIVIVDEVHMLSSGAFNALLKTLEEPPLHVKFIFATTESHKVPITIRSRCQCYDFRLIPQSVVAARVRQILETENLPADADAVLLVAREAAGSMRDALTLLDQLIAFSDGELRGHEAEVALGVANRHLVRMAAEGVLSGEPQRVLDAVRKLAEDGLDLHHYTKRLAEYLRDLAVLRVVGDDGSLVDMVDEERAEALQFAGQHGALEIQRAFSAVSLLVDEVGRSSLPRITLEMGLLRLATRPPLEELSKLAAKLENLAESQGRPPERAPSRGGSGSGQSEPIRAGKTPSVSQPAKDVTSSSPAVLAERTTTSSPDVPAAPSAPATRLVEQVPPETSPVSERLSSPTPPEASAELSSWERIVMHLDQHRPALAAVLKHATPAQISADLLILSFPEGSFFGHQAQTAEAKESIADAAQAILQKRPKVDVRFSSNSDERKLTLAKMDAERLQTERAEQRAKALNHPRVIEALQVFPESAGKVDVHLDVE